MLVNNIRIFSRRFLMLRNKSVFLTVVTILALASFGFTSFGAVSAGSGGAYSVAIQSLPAASTNVITTTSDRCQDTDKDDHNCGEDGAVEPDADENLAAVKVSPALAGICALHKQPAGTQVSSVDGVFAELSFPYYKVTLAGPQGNPVVYVNATSCNIIPAP
jgi:hypothetical protein